MSHALPKMPYKRDRLRESRVGSNLDGLLPKTFFTMPFAIEIRPVQPVNARPVLR